MKIIFSGTQEAQAVIIGKDHVSEQSSITKKFCQESRTGSAGWNQGAYLNYISYRKEIKIKWFK